ncbi:hypothetical protein EIN_337140 [Entamoeba invadens IP1]|uniref:Leucine rich repeat containing protein BspA family protein n=1 Tax=Entamoeba invadens IP1 TaxID=370355 RepID=L7FM36_ENTIV|nr:hypothetical protein EIN_337140 [Entamoeba invadens IP1]ELP87665.1 hypothetical protein EIN_337140 [Entamoeba invadens IP1]|eukprot:XP_004254436.1 hypothetical protein EIN_337140 [Entamoeba invadens IP1]
MKYGNTIPKFITELSRECFCDSEMTSIDLPNLLTLVGERWCYSLQSVTFPSHITIIESACFSQCSSLRTVDIPNCESLILNCAFLSCSHLTSVSIKGNVRAFGNSCFYFCESLVSIDIPSCVSKFDNNCFRCFKLYTVYINLFGYDEVYIVNLNIYMMMVVTYRLSYLIKTIDHFII